MGDPYSLNGLAAVAVETGEFERAATLLGAAAALQEQQGIAWPPDEAPHFERSRAAVADALDRDQLERAWSAGQRMPSAEAVWYALAPRSDLASHTCMDEEPPFYATLPEAQSTWGNAGPHSGGPPRTRTEEARGSNPSPRHLASSQP